MTGDAHDTRAERDLYVWPARDIAIERRVDGTVLLASRIPLGAFAPHVPSWLAHHAEHAPDRTWLAKREPQSGEWRRISYGEAKRQVDALTQAIIDQGLRSDPIMILSDNSIAHALITMAAMQAQVPVAPVSPAYSLMNTDHAKLRYVFELLQPSALFVEDAAIFSRAIAALDLRGICVIAVANVHAIPGAMNFADLVATAPTDAVAHSVSTIRPNTVAKYLLTSGSTGMPKAVINTQGMLCANRAMIAHLLNLPRPDRDEECAVVDWMPWNHTMAGNATFDTVLELGYSLYIDDGRPIPGRDEATIANLSEISPILHSSAPIGYAVLVTAMEQDATLAQSFFRRLVIMMYGGARLPEDIAERLKRLAVQTTGHNVPLVSMYGSTETAPSALGTYWPTERNGLIGLPPPGIDLKLVPYDSDRFELRIRALTVTPGYYRQEDLTRHAFDSEGYYRLGDLVSFADQADVNQGLVFAGRLAEEFKLLTGTFVPTNSVRVGAVSSLSPLVTDAIVIGQDRDFVGLLVWLNLAACRALVWDAGADPASLVRDPRIRASLAVGLRAWNDAQGNASSRSIQRMLILVDPPSMDAGEITDKGHINQQAARARRADDVDRLYRRPLDPQVIVPAAGPTPILEGASA